MMSAKQIFVNFPVKDLKKSIEFFTKLGFAFNPKFTNENATCMIVGENIFAMLLVEKYFKTFTPKQVSDAHNTTEVILALQFDSRDEVDTVLKKGLAAGGKEPRPTQDLGFMYNRALEDLDGHIWEIFFMDMIKMPQG